MAQQRYEISAKQLVVPPYDGSADKLDIWKFHARTVLRAAHADHVLDTTKDDLQATLPAALDDEADEEKEEVRAAEAARIQGLVDSYDDAAAYAYVLLVNATNGSKVPGVETAVRKCDVNDAHGVWNAITRYHQLPSAYNKLALRDKISAYKLDDFAGMQEYINAYEEGNARLREMGSALDDLTLVQYMLRGLNSQYEQLDQVLRINDRLDLRFVIERLLDWSTKVQPRDPQDRALHGRADAGRNDKANKPCYNCGKLGHFMIDCHAA